MSLLAEIYSRPEMVQKMLGNASSIGKQEFDLNNESCEATEYEVNPYILSTLTPRLWPFMRHNITSVRHSAICTLVCLCLCWSFIYCTIYKSFLCFLLILYSNFPSNEVKLLLIYLLVQMILNFCYMSCSS